MRRLLKLSVMIFTMLASLAGKVESVQALPCVPGSLQNYINLGAGGCTIGSDTLSGFVLLSIPAAATPIPAANVSVIPIQNIADFGLDFGLNTNAPAGEFFDIRFGYNVTGLLYSGASVGLSGSEVTPDGANTAIMDLCRGNLFVPAGGACSGVPTTLIAFDIGVDAQLLDSTTFAPVSLLDVVNDIGVDGGLDGGASLTGASNRFTVASASGAVPEPAAFLLVALGLLVLRFATRCHRQS